MTSSPTRDAIVFLPALGAEWGDEGLEQTAHRMATALERKAQSAAAKFSVDLKAGEEKYSDEQKTRVCTIVRADESNRTPVADLYSFYYQDALTERFAKRNLVTKAFFVLLAIVVHLPRVVRALFSTHTSKSPRETIQFVYAILILLLLCLYLGFLCFALYQTARGLTQLGGSNPDVSVPQLLVVAGAGIGVFIPRLRDWVSEAAVSYISLINYLSFGDRREVISGRLADLLEYVAEKDNPLYSRIIFLAYSFGTIVALDTLFPQEEEPSDRYRLIETLVTIGTPYDAIRSWWKSYFTERHGFSGYPENWLNVYAPADVLGSNFRMDGVQGEATDSIELLDGSKARLPNNLLYSAGPRLDEVGRLETITLIGLRVHAMYWQKELEAESAYGLILERLYEGKPALA